MVNVVRDSENFLKNFKIFPAKQTAIATEAQARAAAATARASESIAYSTHWRNSRSLSRQGLRMLSGACTLGKNC